MHFTYKESCDAVGYDRLIYRDAPELKYKLIGYLEGNSVICEDEATWKLFKLRERIPTPESKKLRDAFFETQDVLQNKALEHFDAKLREYFSELSDSQFRVCYSNAYDDCHAYGHDSVADKLEQYVEMCQEFVLIEGKN